MNDFDLRLPTSRRFFETFANKVNLGNEHRLLGEFFLELALFEAEQLRTNDDALLAMATLLLVGARIYLFNDKIESSRRANENINAFLEQQNLYAFASIRTRAELLEKSEYCCMRTNSFPNIVRKYLGFPGKSAADQLPCKQDPTIIRALIAPGRARYVYHRPVEKTKGQDCA